MRLAMQRHARLFLFRMVWLLLVCACFSLLSCRSSSDSPVTPTTAISPVSGSAPASIIDTSSGIDLSKQPGTRYQVTYADGVVRVSAETLKKTLQGANRDHDIYVKNFFRQFQTPSPSAPQRCSEKPRSVTS